MTEKISVRKKILLLDANVLVDYYLKQKKKIIESVENLRGARLSGRCLLFVPIFCIAETFSTFAKKRFLNSTPKKKDAINVNISLEAKWAFDRDVSREYEFHKIQYFTPLPLDRYHLFNAHLVYEPAWKRIAELQRKYPKDFGKKFLSTFDLLVIAQGIEMTYLYHEEDFRLITSDVLMLRICEYLRTLKEPDKLSFARREREDDGQYTFRKDFKYPRTLKAWDPKEVDEFLGS